MFKTLARKAGNMHIFFIFQGMLVMNINLREIKIMFSVSKINCKVKQQEMKLACTLSPNTRSLNDSRRLKLLKLWYGVKFWCVPSKLSAPHLFVLTKIISNDKVGDIGS